MNKKLTPAYPRNAMVFACTLGLLSTYAGQIKAATMAYEPPVLGMSDPFGSIRSGTNSEDVDAFLPLVRSLSDRLDTATQVALNKWDSGQAVCAPEREAQVLEAAVAMAPAYGLTSDDARSVFADQIEANKEIQYALLDGWRRAGVAPSTAREDLSTTVRPKLDELQKVILRHLQTLNRLRRSPACHVYVALAVGRVAQEKSLDALTRAALDRSTASICLNADFPRST